MADGNTKSKDTKDAQERHEVDFEKDAAEDINPPPMAGDRDGWRRYWQNLDYSGEELEEKMLEMEQFSAGEASPRSPGMSWWDEKKPEEDSQAEIHQQSSSGSFEPSAVSNQNSNPPQPRQEDDRSESPDAEERDENQHSSNLSETSLKHLQDGS